MTKKNSRSPYSDIYEYKIDHVDEKNKIDQLIRNNRINVIVQGLGFVGSAMVAALTNATNNNHLIYNVIGIDLSDERNYWKIARANEGKPPIVSNDKQMDVAFEIAHSNSNFLATYSEYAYSIADIVVIDIHLDINKESLGDAYNYTFSYGYYKQAIELVATNISENTLVVIETTVPPGTTEQVIYPVFQEKFKNRELDIDKFYLAHSYERVMPGKNYLDSIINYYRVYSGINEVSKLKAKKFLESFINTTDYPLTQLHSTTASEMSKVLENSFRAMNIAFIQEWSEYAYKSNVNLFEVVEAIRVRSTHKNIMLPGFGVGGYCLTKDSLLADWSYNTLFSAGKRLNMSLDAVNINDLMPNYCFELIKNELGNVDGLTIGIFGISYLSDVSDTRYSPTEVFYDKCIESGLNVVLHDPIVEYWEEKNIFIKDSMNSILSSNDIDILIFTVRHNEYLNIDVSAVMKKCPSIRVVIDAFDIIDDVKAEQFASSGVKLIGLGKGHWNNLK